MSRSSRAGNADRPNPASPAPPRMCPGQEVHVARTWYKRADRVRKVPGRIQESFCELIQVMTCN